MSEITVCIPTYEYKGRGVEFLAELFDSLERQTFTDFDIVISDHSKDDTIKSGVVIVTMTLRLLISKTQMGVVFKHLTQTVLLKMRRVESSNSSIKMTFL